MMATEAFANITSNARSIAHANISFLPSLSLLTYFNDEKELPPVYFVNLSKNAGELPAYESRNHPRDISRPRLVMSPRLHFTVRLCYTASRSRALSASKIFSTAKRI